MFSRNLNEKKKQKVIELSRPMQVCDFYICTKKAKKTNRLLRLYSRNIFFCRVLQICVATCLRQLRYATKQQNKRKLY